MSARTHHRPRVEALVEALVVLAAVALLAAAAWSVVQVRSAGRADAATGPGEVAVGHGLARVEQVVSAARPGHGMPGMGTDNDPVADDERRVTLDVTLRAAEDEALRYDVERFALQVAGGQRRPHRAVLPAEELPAGTQLTGTLVFDVPRAATDAVLTYDSGPGTDVSLPPEGGGAGTPDPGPEPGPEPQPSRGAVHAGGHDG